ncbi:MAG: archaemetzincin family Zn-dependent metalloprotease [Anaerolineae bacterium]
MPREVLLVPIGEVEPDLLTWLTAELEAALGCPVTVGEPVPIPREGYDPHRRQYRGESMLATLRAVSAPAGRILGLVEADCYAPGLNFIFGQATLRGREAFVALSRLRPSFYGLPDDPVLFRQRALKEALHELGHTWGLGHCPDPRCVMHFSNTLHDTDVKGASFCSRCRKQLLAPNA